MKTNRMFSVTAALLLSALWLNSCTDYCCMQSSIQVSAISTFSWEGAETLTAFVTSSTDWQLSGNLPHWIKSVTPAGGPGGTTEVQIIALMNTRETTQTGALTFLTANGDKAVLTIEQHPAGPPLFMLEDIMAGTKISIAFDDSTFREITVDDSGRIPAWPGEAGKLIRTISLTDGNNNISPVYVGRFAEAGKTIRLKFDDSAPQEVIFREADADGFVPVGTVTELGLIGGALTGAYRQEADLDLTGHNWTPIGNNSHHFTGTYDGNGKTIGRLYVYLSNMDYVGLFGYIGAAGAVKSLRVEGAVTGRDYVGGIAGYMYDGSIEDCSSAVAVTGRARTGGVAGALYEGSVVSRCYATGDVTDTGTAASDHYTGGIAGSVNSGAISDCYATGNVAGNSGVGGVVGLVNSAHALVERCYATGTVSGNHDVGGVAGVSNSSGEVRYSIALNPWVKCTTENVGRVVYTVGTAITDNSAWSGIGTNGGIAFSLGIYEVHNRKDGVSKTSEDVQTAAGFPWNVTASPWTYSAGSLPGLGATVEMPAHLQP